MVSKVKVEHTLYDTGPDLYGWVDLEMTNERGTTYTTMVDKFTKLTHNYVINQKTKRMVRLQKAPKWVQKTIEEQLPVAAIMLS